MNPVLFEIFGIPVYSYGFFLAFAFMLCLMLILRRAKSMNVAPHYILDLGLYLIISGIVGARMFYIISNLDYYIENPFEIILLNKGGLVFHGGLILSLIVGILVVKLWKLPVLKMADLVITFLPLGQAIGRVGCFLNGCCYGKPTESIFGIKFPEYSFAANAFGPDIYVYPTQIFSSIADLSVFFILLLRMKKKEYDGQAIVYYLFLYGVARFLLEFLRADNPPILYGFNIQQIISILMAVIALILWPIFKNAKHESI
jgi:phosphatidylglycerol:prolipoprotein diacylglycerol transferase